MTRRASTTEWGPNIDRLRDEEGWTQRELAEKSGLSENQITILLTKDSNPRMGSLRAVIEAFNAARQARGAPQIQLWQVFLPADLATNPNKGVELGTPLTLEPQQPSNVPREAPAQPPDVHDEAVRSKILATIRELASALEPPERGEEGRLIARRALAQSQTVDHGSPPRGDPHRPSRRRRDSA